MSASEGGGATPSNQGTDRPIRDTIDFVYDQTVEGNVAVNAEVKGNDYTDIVGDNTTATNEVIEVFKVELIPPKNANGSLQDFDYLRLWDGESYYPHIRYREFMMGYFGPDNHLTTPMLGTPVLSGNANPDQNPIATATPKYGTDTVVSPAIQNNGTAITDSFRVRYHVYRWRGTDDEFSSFFSNAYGSTTFNQNIRMSNPYTGAARTYNRSSPVRIQRGADGGALGQWTKLTGGIDQELPKVFPWIGYTENNNATRANREYEFTTRNDRVDDTWNRLEFDFTDQKKAVFFDSLQVNEPANLSEGVLAINERDEDPRVQLTPNSAHELPILRPRDGSGRDEYGNDQIPVDLSERFGRRQVLWDDGGGFRVQDDGTSIPAGDILIGFEGRFLELTS